MNKIEHLKMIQAVIGRMAGNSFFTKSWCVTLVSAIIVLVVKESNRKVAVIAFFPIIMFWILDSYFLYQERLFRRLYDFVRLQESGKETDFSMDTSLANIEGDRKITWLGATFSSTLVLFYMTMLIVALFTVLQAMFN